MPMTMPRLHPSPVVRAVLLAVAASTLVALGSGAPAQAGEYWSFDLDSRPEGLPTTDASARRLTAGQLRHSSDRDSQSVSATIELEQEPVVEDDAVLTVGFGTIEEGGAGAECVPSWQRSVSTFAPESSTPDPTDRETAASRDGATLLLSWSLSSEQYALAARNQCASARLVDPADGNTLDGLDGLYGSGVIFDPYYDATIDSASGRHVRPGHWSKLTVQVTSKSDVRGFRLGGGGRGVTVRERHFDRRVPSGSTTVVHLRVRLNRENPRRGYLYLDTDGSAFGPVDRKRFRLVPQRHRSAN